MSGTPTPAGWYPDPNDPSMQRYWDGAAWTENTAPGAGAAPAYGAQPYGAPGYGTTQVGYGYAQAVGAPLAGFGSRLGAYLLDAIGLGIIVSIILAVLGVDSTAENGSVDATYQFLSFILTMPYFVYFEGTTGQTLGKKLLGIQVVHADTMQPGIGLGRAAGRYFGRILSSIPCGLGYFWMLWDDQKQTWHDKVATTKVIKVS